MDIERVPNRNSPPAVLLRESWREGGALDLFGAHFSVYIDGTGRVVELLDEQGVPFSDLEEMTPDAVEVVTAVQILLSRNEPPLSELAFGGPGHDRKSGF